MQNPFPLLLVLLCLVACQRPEDPVPQSPAYDTGYLLFQNAAGDTLYHEVYTDWCNIPGWNNRVEAGGLSLGGGPSYTYMGYKGRTGRTPLFSVYQGVEAGVEPGPGLVQAYQNNDYSIFEDPNTHYVVACKIDGVKYSSHLFNYQTSAAPYLQRSDPNAVLTAISEYFYPAIQECRSSSQFLLRTDLHYTGQLYRGAERVDSVAVTVDMLVNIGI